MRTTGFLTVLASGAVMTLALMDWQDADSPPVRQSSAGADEALAGPSGAPIERERISPPTALSVYPTGPLPEAFAVSKMMPQGLEGLPLDSWALPGSILVEVVDAATNDPVSHFNYVVEVIGKRPTRGSSGISHRARAPAPVDMPFNIRIEAEGYQPSWLRQVLLRRGQQAPSHTIRLQPAR